MMPKLRAKQLRNAAFYVMVVLMAALTLLPFLFMLSSSFKGEEAIRTIPIRWIPERPTLEGYIRVFNMPGFSFPRASLNSLFLALATTLVQVLSACMAAFVFAKLPFRGSDKLFGLYLATMMIPGTVTMVPNYIILRIMGLLDSYTGLILPALANAFGVFLMRQAMITVPDSYLWPLIVLTSTGKQTLQVVLGNMNSMYRNNEHVLMAGAVLTILPILLVYVLSQRRVDSGIALGGLK